MPYNCLEVMVMLLTLVLVGEVAMETQPLERPDFGGWLSSADTGEMATRIGSVSNANCTESGNKNTKQSVGSSNSSSNSVSNSSRNSSSRDSNSGNKVANLQMKDCFFGDQGQLIVSNTQYSSRKKGWHIAGDSLDNNQRGGGGGVRRGSFNSSSTENVVRNPNGLDIWHCLFRRAHEESLRRSSQKKKKKKKKQQRKNQVTSKRGKICSSDSPWQGNGTKMEDEEGKKEEEEVEEEEKEVDEQEEEEEEEEGCLPLLFLIFPTLCNETRLCVNITETSFEAIQHQYWIWKKKKKLADESSEAVVYIVVVLAFYSFGIVFMMANFIRQEQRELEETKLYKQYVKVARDRWLTSRGNMANKLALQALNTFNAVPQTTDDNKITFV